MQLSEVDENELNLGTTSDIKSSGSGASYSGFENPFRDLAEPREKEERNDLFSGSRSSSRETVEEFPPRDIENLKKNEPVIKGQKNVVKNVVTVSETASQDSAISNFDYNLVFPPQTFHVVLIIDDRETAG